MSFLSQCKVQVFGRIVRDPEFGTTQKSGAPRATFSVAVNWKDRDGNEQHDFYSCTAVGVVVDVLKKHAAKGVFVAVYGTLTHRKYQDKDGYEAISYDVFASDVLIDTKPNGNGNGHHEEAAPARRPAPAQQAAPAAPAQDDDELDWAPPERTPARPARPAAPAAPAARPVIKTAAQARAVTEQVRQAQQGSDVAHTAPPTRPTRPVRPTIAETPEEDLPF